MKLPMKKLIAAATLVLLLAIGMSTDALGQGRNRRVFGQMDKKCGKFVNCHDARDGRWDGRGPRRNNTVLTGNIFRRSRRNRDRDFDRDRRVWRRHGNHRFRR
ncbi:MAG TPA: hypothetical protein VGW58_05025 [Pyrinomonadaceae bacterium]|nr:hypothetical protein [Pyrinomonadaceae bacterium]